MTVAEMTGIIVEAPRANANDDTLQVIEIAVADGQTVAAGDLLFVLETTKAAVEIVAPAGGVVEDVCARVGDFVPVGAVLCRISGGMGGPAALAPLPDVGTAEVVITAKARRIAAELGVDLAQVTATMGRIGEAEVRTAHRGHTALAEPALVLASAGGRRAVIVGGGGHAACLIDALQGAGFDIIGCLDRTLPAGMQVLAGVTILGDEGLLETLREDGVAIAFVGIGGADNSRARRAMFERLTAMGFDIPAVIHSRAVVAGDVVVGRGCHVLAGATIGPRCQVGENVIVNQGSIVCHDSSIGDHAHIAPGAILAGSVRVGRNTVVGMGATALFGIVIGDDCLVHNGANVGTDVAAGTVVDGAGRRTSRSA